MLFRSNIEDDDETDNKTIIPINVELTEDSFVDIPTTSLQVGDIILYDCNVQVTFDKPEIHLVSGIEVSSPTPTIQSGDNAEIYAQLLDTDGKEYNINDASGKTVYFYEKLEPTITVTADKNIIQSGDTVDISATVVDEDGSKPKNAKVYFYKED